MLKPIGPLPRDGRTGRPGLNQGRSSSRWLGLAVSLLLATAVRTLGADTPPAVQVAGNWEGSWLSDANHHHGRLRCRVTEVTPNTFKARYKATYWKIFRFSYTVTLKGQFEAGIFRFSGDENLGWWAGGTYHYQGQVTATNFVSTYRCKFDHGTFQMQRVAGK